METKNLSNATAVLTEIVRIESKLDLLKNVYSLKPYKNVKILFSGFNEIGVEQMIILDASNFPFSLNAELINLIEDSIEDYYRDLSSLKNHLKNI